MLKDKYGIKVLFALEPIAEDEGGEFYEMFLEWNAEKYSKRLSKRVKDGLDTSVANGTYCGGTLIYGYKLEQEPINGKSNKFIKRVIINEEEARIIRYAFEEYNKGTTKKEIAESLNKQGLKLKGKLFTSKSFDKWLVNRKYTGEFYFGNRLCTNMYPQIVDKELFEDVQKRLNKNRYFAGGVATAKIPYLLTGKLFCGHCGTEMVSDGGTGKLGKRHYYYTCKKKKKGFCDKKREDKEKLELYVTSCVIDFLSDKKNADIAVSDVLNYYDKKTDENNIKSIKAKISKANKEVEELSDTFVKAKSSLLKKTIETKMEEYEKYLSDLYFQEAQLELERGYKIKLPEIFSSREFLLGLIDLSPNYIAEMVENNMVGKEFILDAIEKTPICFAFVANWRKDDDVILCTWKHDRDEVLQYSPNIIEEKSKIQTF